MRVSLRSAEGHQRDLLDPPRLQPLGGHKRALAASATKNNALGGQRFRDDFRHVIDIETARARERRPRRLFQAAQIDHKVIGPDRFRVDERQGSRRLRRAGKAQAAEGERSRTERDDLAHLPRPETEQQMQREMRLQAA